MPRIYPEVPLSQVIGEVANIPRRYERVNEYTTSFTIPAGAYTGSTTIIVAPNVVNRDIMSVRAYLSRTLSPSAANWSVYLFDSGFRRFYANEYITGGQTSLVDSNLRIQVEGNIICVVRFSHTQATGTTVSLSLGTRETVLEV